MSDYDRWLLEGSEPEQYDEDSAPHGLCDLCESPLELHAFADGEFCPVCEPRCMVEDSPVRASFLVVDGRVSLNGGTP